MPVLFKQLAGRDESLLICCLKYIVFEQNDEKSHIITHYNVLYKLSR